MKKYVLATILSAMVLGAAVSTQAATLWTGIQPNKAAGIYWPLGNSGLNLGTFAGVAFPSDSTKEFGINGGQLSLDGIPVMGGVELGIYFTKGTGVLGDAATKGAGLNYGITLGKAFMFDLTDDVQIGFYEDLITYSRSSGSDNSTITILGNLYPVLSAEVKLW